MKETIYVELLNEGTNCWRPVEAERISDNVYLLLGHDIHNPEDEEWEFLPGTHVIVEDKKLSSGIHPVAIKKV